MVLFEDLGECIKKFGGQSFFYCSSAWEVSRA